MEILSKNLIVELQLGGSFLFLLFQSREYIAAGLYFQNRSASTALGTVRCEIFVEKRLIKDRGVSYVQASQDLGVHTSHLRSWVKSFEDDPQHAFPGHGQTQQSLQA